MSWEHPLSLKIAKIGVGNTLLGIWEHLFRQFGNTFPSNYVKFTALSQQVSLQVKLKFCTCVAEISRRNIVIYKCLRKVTS